MNTRLQVEHPVTELITGLDLVEQMIRVAAGEPLGFAQDDLKIDGWAIESRIYAEDPYRRFLPSIGRLSRYAPPAEGRHGIHVVRNDSGVREGDEISMFYDPMIAKLCAWGPNREAAVDGMALALEDLHIEGVRHNAAFLSAVMDQKRFRSGKLSTAYIPDEFPEGFNGLPPTDEQLDIFAAVAAAMHTIQVRRARTDGAPLRPDWRIVLGRRKRDALLEWEDATLRIEFPEDRRTLRLDHIDWRPGKALFRGRLDTRQFTVEVAPAAEGFVIRHRACTLRVLVLTPVSADLHERLPEKKAADTSRMVVSPMPGLVVSLDVEVGQEIKEGEALCVVEAMKMQNIIRAERDGVIKTINAKAGDSVAADDVLIEFV
jgi:propionyl-CoA carboxylase alpha chain